MSDERIPVPEVPPGEMGVMIYRPYFSKKKSAWVPGAYPSHTSCLTGTWAEFVAGLAGTPPIVPEKGKIIAMSAGWLVDGAEKRANRYVRNVQTIMLDIDTGLPDIEDACRRIKADGIEFVVYASVSSGLPGKGTRARIILRITEPIPAHLGSKAIRAIFMRYTRDGTGRIAADKSCVDISRVMYMPAMLAGNESNYFFCHEPGIPLPTEEIMDMIGSVSTLVTSTRSSEDRIDTIANARGLMGSSARAFNRDDITALAKNKKAILTSEQRASLKGAADAERMAVVKNEPNPKTVRLGASQGGLLPDENIDSFLTSLMFKVACYYRNADPSNIQTAFAPSFSLLQQEDAAAGNTSYNDDGLRSKFESGVRAADEKSVDDAKKTGLPTFEEFKAEQGIQDEGDLSSALPGKVYLGQKCFYKVRTGADGEPKLVPVSDFAIIPREHLISDTSDDLKHFEEIYEVDFISQHAKGVKVERKSLPPSVLMGRKEFNAYLASVNPLAFRGDDEEAKYLRTILHNYVLENDVPQKRMTHRLGLRRSGALVTPQGSFKWVGGYEVEIDPDAPTYAASMHYETNLKIKQETERRSIDVDIDAIRIFAQNVARQNAPEVMWPILGWFAGSVLRDSLNQFPTLQIVGTKGSGKSAIARKLKEAFAGSEVSVGGMPRYSQAKEISANVSFPVIFEEFRARKHHSVQGLRDNIRDNYTRQQLSRSGFKTLTLESPMCVVGENEVARGGPGTDGATLQRMAFSRPEITMLDPKKSPEAYARRAAFAAISKLAMEDTGHWALFACWAGATFCDRVDAWMIERMRTTVDAYVSTLPTTTQNALDERTKYNLSVLLFGVYVWSQWCIFLGVSPGPLPTIEQVCMATIGAVAGTEAETPDEQSDPLARYIETLSHMLTDVSDGNAALGVKHWWLREGDTLYIDVSASRSFYDKHSEDDGAFSSSSAVYQFARESPFAVFDPKGSERFRKRIHGSGMSQSRCFAVSISKLGEANVTLADALLVDSYTPSEGGFR